MSEDIVKIKSDIAEWENKFKGKLEKNGIKLSTKPIISMKRGSIYLLIDSSGSMDGDKLDQAKKGAKEYMTDAVKKNYSIGIINFGSNAQIISKSILDANILSELIDNIHSSGSTNMAEAIELCRGILCNVNGYKAMIICTDAFPNNRELAIQNAKKAKSNGIEIFTIGTDDADINFLELLSSKKSYASFVDSKDISKAIYSTFKLLPS